VKASRAHPIIPLLARPAFLREALVTGLGQMSRSWLMEQRAATKGKSYYASLAELVRAMRR
jgi:hypothetical protein